MQHIIKKQIIDLQMHSLTDAFRAQQRVSTHFHQKVISIIQHLFDSVSNEDEVISIDRLEIDIGSVTMESLERGTWTDDIYSKLAEGIDDLIAQGSSRQKPLHKAIGASIYQQWLCYMQNGYLPWNVIQVNETWLAKLLETLATDITCVQSLRHELKNNPILLNRIILQHTERFLVNLVETLTAQNQVRLPQAIEEMEAIFSHNEAGKIIFANRSTFSSSDKKALIRQLWALIISLAANTSADAIYSTEKITASILAGQIRIGPADGNSDTIRAIKKDLPGKPSFTGPILDELVSRLKPSGSESSAAKSLPGISTEETAQPSPTSHEGPQQDLASARAKAALDQQLEQEGIFVPHAGIVLLHPFLSTFFNRLDLLQEGKKFKDGAAHRKALHLLHYLATGTTQAAEYELQMAKILCAFPADETVEPSFDLTEQEMEEADDLLTACIQQWTALQNTSRAGLRECFLQRNGKLLIRNGKLQLEVEAVSIDVLLDYLPWNLSMIKLPWMTEILCVNWR